MKPVISIRPVFRTVVLLACLCGLCTFGAAAGRIRIVPEKVEVESDSLRLNLSMDLDSVRVSTGSSWIFTPYLKNGDKYLELPGVVVTGRRRAHFDRRERSLSSLPGAIEPYRVIIDDRHRSFRPLSYEVSVPYASWMNNASLLLMQESKDCCVKQVMSIETLTPDLALRYTSGSNRMESASVSEPVPVQSAPVVVPAYSGTPLAVSTYSSMVSYLVPDTESDDKKRTDEATLYIDYPLNAYKVLPDFRLNRREIDKLDSLLMPVLQGGFSQLKSVRIHGYASPDGNYQDNERLSSSRSKEFRNYMREVYRLPESVFDVTWTAEDWVGTEQILKQLAPPYSGEALSIIRTYGIFDGREKRLMELHGGDAYRDMLKTVFPWLRRIEVHIGYEVRRVSTEEASRLIYTHPELLSLREMYAVARYYRPGTEQYREIYEIAAYHYPDDVVANINASSAVMLTGDIRSAWNYLRKVESSPKAWNNMGVLTLMEGDPSGASAWFRKAVGVEPQKARANLRIAEGMMNGSVEPGQREGEE